MKNRKKKASSLRDNHPIIFYIKARAWLRLAVVPLVATVVITGLLVEHTYLRWGDPLTYIIPVLGTLAGTFFATYAAYVFGLLEIDARHHASLDIDQMSKSTTEKDKKMKSHTET